MVELPTIAIIVSLTTVAGGFLAWLRKDEREKYARQRQLEHALNNYQTVSTAVIQLEDKVDEGFQQVALELSQIKTLLSLSSAESNGAKVRSVRRP
jgi:hypothetical protein